MVLKIDPNSMPNVLTFHIDDNHRKEVEEKLGKFVKEHQLGYLYKVNYGGPWDGQLKMEVSELFYPFWQTAAMIASLSWWDGDATPPPPLPWERSQPGVEVEIKQAPRTRVSRPKAPKEEKAKFEVGQGVIAFLDENGEKDTNSVLAIVKQVLPGGKYLLENQYTGENIGEWLESKMRDNPWN